MKINPMDARKKNIDVWVAAYTFKWKIMPRKVMKITKKFVYFDLENQNDKLEHYKLKDSEVAGLWTTESEAWKHIAMRCIKDIEWAKELIDDFETIESTHPEAFI